MSEQLVTQRYSSADSNQAGGFVFDVIGSNYYAVSKLAWGAVGAANYVALDAALPVQPGTGATWAMTAEALPLPSGAASEAKQDTAIAGLATLAGYVDGIEALLAVIEANQLADGHNVTIDNASLPVTGTFWPDTQPVSIDSVPSHDVTNAGTFPVQAAQNGAWAMTANAGTNLNTSALALEAGNLATLTSFITALSKTNGASDTGTLRVTIANNSTGVIATVGQITQVVHIDDNGDSVTVDGTVTAELSTDDVLVLSTIAAPVATLGATPLMRVAIFDDAAQQITSFGGGTQYAVDDALGATPTGTVALAKRDNALSTLTPAEGDAVELRVDANGALWVTMSGTVTVASHAVTNAGTFPVQAAQSGTWNITNISGTISLPTGAATESTLSTINGKITTCNTGAVVLAAGTAAIGKLAANSGVTIGAVEIAAAQTLATVTTVGTVTTCSTVTTVGTLTGSGVAHDGADSGNPHKIGAKATTSLSAKTMVANNDRTDLFAGVDGVVIMRSHCNLEDIVTSTPVAITDGSSTSVIAAQGASIKTYITGVTIANSSASFVTVDLRDGTGGAVKWTFPVPPSGGVTHKFDPPLPFSANTAVAADPSAAASTITVSLIGFKSKV